MYEAGLYVSILKKNKNKYVKLSTRMLPRWVRLILVVTAMIDMAWILIAQYSVIVIHCCTQGE